MDKFPLSMKKKYKGRLINREKQWPPRHSNMLVRLEPVEREYQSTRRVKKVKQTPLAYGDLFKGESGKERVRKVLVEGDAGIGKTTLTISLSEDWACGELFQEFELLLLLSLRQKKVASAGSLRELLKLFHSDPEACESVARYIEKEEAEKVLVIADGWDELGESERREGSFLYQLLFKMFPFMSVVVTSRPFASAPLHNLPCIDRFVEVSGFSKDDIIEYIQSEFSGDQEKAHRLLEQNPLIGSTCSVPLNCAIVCHLWHTLEEALPSTMTQLYTKLTLYVVCRNLRKLEAYGPTFGMSSFDELPEGLQQSWSLLCQFACEALDKDEIVFSKKELLEFFPQGLTFDDKIFCFGLLQSAETVSDVTCVVSFNFVHLTFMEYLAAVYLSRQPLDRQLQFLQKPRFTMVARFLFGICFSRSSSVTQYLDVKQIIQCVAGTGVYDINKLSLCHCAFEAQNNSINNTVIQVITNKPSYLDVDFGYPRTAHDCAAVLYVIDHMQECSRLDIDFSNSGISENQIRTLTDVLASKHGKLQVKKLNLSGNKLTDKSVSDLFHRASAAFQSLTNLDLNGNSIGAESIKSITTPLPNLTSSGCRLTSLSLSDNPLGVSGLQALEKAVCDNLLSKLRLPFLAGSLTSDADANATFIEALSAHCTHLLRLDLSRNNLGVPGATALARVISRLQHQSQSDGEVTLHLDQTNFGDKGLCAFIENINCVCHLDGLELNDNGIHATAFSCLADAVCLGIIVIKHLLVLSDNPLRLRGTLAIGRMLSSNHCQSWSVLLSRCELSTAGGGLPNTGNIAVTYVGQQLCQMPQNNNITRLNLDGNSFTGEGIQILAGFMYICTCLKHLSSGNCGITSDDLKQLFDKLSQLKSSSPSLCSKLESWWLNDNVIEDSGVLALVDYLPSLFPRLGCGIISSVYLWNNSVSSEMQKMLEEELRRCEESLYPPESSSELLSFTEFSSYSDSKGEKEHLSVPFPPQRPHPLTTLQCADVHREIGDVNLSNNPVSSEMEKMPKEELRRRKELQSPESSSDGLSDQEDSDSDEEEEPLSFTESSGDSNTKGEEDPLSVAVALQSPRPHPLTTSSTKRKRFKDIKPPKPIQQFTTATGESDKAQKVVRSGQITDPDHLFNAIAEEICSKYMEIGIELGLKIKVLTNELETGIFMTLPGNRRALRMLQLWQESVTKDDFKYSVLAAALEEKGFRSCAYKYCYTTALRPAAMDSGCAMERRNSCDQSRDSSDPENEIFSTPPTSPVPPQHDDRELLDVSCGAKCLSSTSRRLSACKRLEPIMKYLNRIEILQWQTVGLELGVKDYDLQVINVDYTHHHDKKREMFRKWVGTVVNPNYHDLIKVLERVGERKAAQQVQKWIF